MTGAIVMGIVPTVVGMGVVSETTKVMFDKGRRSRKRKTTKRRTFKIYQGSRGGKYVLRRGKKIYI